MASDVELIVTELTGARASDYTALTSQQVADKLNNTSAPDALSVDVETVEGWQLWGATVQSEYIALTADAIQQSWNVICSATSINVKDTGVRTRVLAIWGAGTATRTALIALQTRLVSRREFIGVSLPKIGAHHVADARILAGI